MSSRLGKVVLSYGIPLALLVWIFHDLNVREAVVSLKRLRWELIPFHYGYSGGLPSTEPSFRLRRFGSTVEGRRV